MLTFLLIQLLTAPIRCLPYPTIHRIGTFLGTVAFYALPKFRKRILSNLSLATELHLSEKELLKVGKASLQNLLITALEYPKFASEKEISRVAHCENPGRATELMKGGTPVIFFCGHLSNWEVLFLEGTQRMPGVAIGRPIKNKRLYNWILKIRQKYGGKIISRKNGVKEGLRGLKNGSFLGIVGDQGMPDSGYCSPFLGKRAWTSPLPALLAQRTGSPIIVATTVREAGKYTIRYSNPIWPDPTQPKEEEIDRMMRLSLSVLEEAIKKDPGQWLWSHNRWKQQTPSNIRRRYRHESICIILPWHRESLKEILPHLPTLRSLYPLEFITVKVPKAFASTIDLEDVEIQPYETEAEILTRDYRFKLIFNFSPLKSVAPFYKKLSAFEVLSLEDLDGKEGDDLSTRLRRRLTFGSPIH